ncbi:hypothetical protein IPV69_13825 [Humisphaera borealis]|uniref:Uncharacterized protein n=1 Tax=Humisphaera borealis TaxID=2807512 RepID=A0A7M2WPN5_9BACT|nr:hypothetical protein IPV69_13825 [Humisphaera borealis]
MNHLEHSMAALINSELSRVCDPAQCGRLQGLLQPPSLLSLAWDYGRPDERFDCWQVGRSLCGRVLLVYCESGFGPSFPWGFVSAAEGSMGMDSQWHSGLEDAAIGAGLLPAPAGYEAPGPRTNPLV